MTEVSKRAQLLASPVRLVAKANPKKNPSMAYTRFQHYFSLKADATVADALKAGIRMDDIRHDSEHGFIVVGDKAIKELAKRLEAEKAKAIEAARKLLAEVDAK